MGYRMMWKMMHLLHVYGRPELSRSELFSAGVDCDPDSMEVLRRGGLVEREQSQDDRFTLTDAGAKCLETFLLAYRRHPGDDIRVDYPSAFVIMPFSESWSDSAYDTIFKPAI